MERNLALELVRVTEASALASARFLGKGDGLAADRAACEAMALAIKGLKIDGTVVIGERNPNAALSRGKRAGAGGDVGVDLALDPLESFDAVAMGRTNAISVAAMTEKGALFYPPLPYMNKIAVGPEAAGTINITASPLENLVNIADAKRTYVEDLTVCILDRERHRPLIEQVRAAGARIRLIIDGDTAAAIATAVPESGIDVLMGIGGSAEGVLSATALRCVGGDFQCQFYAQNDEDAKNYEAAGLGPRDRVFTITDLLGGSQVMFAATGVTDSEILKGVRFRPGGALTQSLVLRSKSGTMRLIETRHTFDRMPDYT
ncbi:MAG: Fructose,6-bisphosphatase, GlpX type [Candidatus Krumholzibacteriota bacterium]|nr:Fructose,6-bisphosphatase, GlpX type [Candidatus Krumholzibacteriota bacterium]